MCRRKNSGTRDAEAGFTFTETLVVIAVITALSAAATVYFFGRYDLVRQHTVANHLAETIRTVQALPEGNPATWQVAAQKVLADMMDATPPAFAAPAGTNASLLPNGLHVGRTIVSNQAIMTDSNGVAVTITGCDLEFIQVTLYPAALPPDNQLQQVGADWLKSQLEIGLPGSMVTAQAETVFCCLPALP